MIGALGHRGRHPSVHPRPLSASHDPRMVLLPHVGVFQPDEIRWLRVDDDRAAADRLLEAVVVDGRA